MSDISQDDILPLEKLYFNESNSLYQLQYNHFNQCIEESIPRALKENPNKFYESISGNKIYSYRFIFEDISIKPPIIPGQDEYMLPEHARNNNYTYSARMEATVKQVQEITNVASGEVTTKVIGDVEKEHPIALIPIMVKSGYCNTNLKKDIKNTECPFDPGCYFIVKGNEKVVIGMERMCDNKVLVYTKKDVNFDDGFQIYATVNSKKPDYTEMIQTINVKMKKNNSIIIETPHFNDVPFVVMIRSLGIISDKDITDYITNDPNDINMSNIIRKSLNDNIMPGFKNEKGEDILIKDQNQAIISLMSKVKKFRKLTDTNEETREEQKKMFIISTLKEDVLPHLGEDLFKKAVYICQMVKKLLNVHLKREDADDRDNYVNKRIDMPGVLITQLFKQYYKRMLNEINKFFEKKYTGDDENPINVINQIKPSTIEQGLINGLSTGVWGIHKARKGVSQALQRYSFPQSISYYRRIVTPSVDSSTQKVVSIRHARNNQFGFLDLVETPEGAKIGLLKHLALTSDVTIYSKSQEEIVNNLISDMLIDISEVHPYFFTQKFKMYLNGNWLGFCDDNIKLYDFLIEQRSKNFINRHTSIINDINRKEIRIYTDGGRMIRPLLKVKNNELNITKKMLNDIDISGKDKSKICRWNLFMIKYPNIVEYIDVEESEFQMIAMEVKDLIEKKKIMSTPLSSPNQSGDRINRYNDTVYVKYTHCEIHPSMMLGSSSSTIPFAEHNQAPRNIYNFSQSKQGKGIFATNERYRMDISYRLANPSYPLIQTRGMKYLKTADLPNGENVIVAIACYSGYNQEDSLVFNRSSLDRGVFRSYVLKKYTDEIKKNPSTSQDDKFTKPDPTKVSGIRKANYEKLNSQGFVPVETKIENGDVIIGKVSPVDPGVDNQAKIYKDTSQIFKSNVNAHIDKVYTGIYNSDGYEMYSLLVRSERIPGIGDKFASRHGQKGTCGIILSSSDMPFTKNGIQPDLIMNPNAVPSRMTVGQLLESVLGKVSALKGQFSDATPFSRYDVKDISKQLKEYGFDEYGYEDLYCGMTGKKIKSKIFIGPTFYMRLKHLVQDKIHSRSRGPRQILTRQPPEGRARDGGLRFGEMERDCGEGNMLITLSNGLSMKIKNMENNKIDVLGFDENKNGLVSSKQVGFLNKGTRPCIELTMEDGRKTVFTEDHPFLTEHNEWIKAKDLIINEDRLKVGITCPELDVEKEITECNNWSLKLNDLTLKTDNKDNYLKTLAFARIIGLLITDGHINKDDDRGSIFLGHKLDVEHFLVDLNMFCDKESYIIQKHCYTVNLPQVFMKNILKLNGLTIGRKVNQKAQLPEFVNNCPKPILREFLGAMFGGDGHTCFLGLHRGKRDLLSSVGFSKSKTEENIESLNDMMEQIKGLLSKFDINEVTIQKPKEISDSKNKENNDKIYEIVLHIALDNLILFSQNIGFRYCCHKLQRLEAGVSYKRLRTETIRQHNWIVNKVDEITNYKAKKLADPSKNVQTKNAISQAVKELTENEPLIHEYVIPTTHDISDHLIKGTKFGSFRSGTFPTAEEFLKKINILDWFLDDSETAYGVQRQNDFLPTMNMKVIGIKPVGDKPVYDISVDKTHSFLAEGVVAHNCMIAHGMGQFLKERLVDTSDQYYVHVCSNCGLFARKRPDRDIYVCQLCNIKNESYTTHKVELPYAFKLLVQELQSINILPKIKVDTNIYNEQPSMFV